jgi:hypothetical protein
VERCPREEAEQQRHHRARRERRAQEHGGNKLRADEPAPEPAKGQGQVWCEGRDYCARRRDQCRWEKRRTVHVTQTREHVTRASADDRGDAGRARHRERKRNETLERESETTPHECDDKEAESPENAAPECG